MIVEIANLVAKPGEADAMRDGLTRARDIISQSPGYLDSRFLQSIEQPDRFVLYIQWENLDAHTEGFRKGPLFPQWRSLWADHLAESPSVLHYEVFAGR